MMQRHARASDLFDQSFATLLKLVQIGRADYLVRCPGKNQVRDLEVADRSIIWVGQPVNLFCNTQRRFSDFVVWADVTHNGRINCVCDNHDCEITGFNWFVSARECTGDDDKGIGGTD